MVEASRASWVTGVVLAGGKSRRFGRDKATAVLQGRRMVDRIVDVLAAQVEPLLIVANDPEPFAGLDARVVGDLYPGTGPLGGLYTALRTMKTEWCLVISCDCPLVEPDVLRVILERMARGTHDAVVPQVSSLPQPLQAGYSCRCSGAIERQIRRGQLKMVDFFPEVQVDCVPMEEIFDVGGSLWSFFNVNTPEDFALAEAYLQGNVRGNPPLVWRSDANGGRSSS